MANEIILDILGIEQFDLFTEVADFGPVILKRFIQNFL